MRVLYDGWPVVHSPLSAAALHMRTLLALTPDGVEALLAMPVASISQQTRDPFTIINQAENNRTTWEQRVVPRLAEQHQAKWIHSTQTGASLFGRITTAISPTSTERTSRSRLGEALSRGGLTRANILWPEDLPMPGLPGKMRPLPPIVHPDFKHGHVDLPKELNLPEEFLLVHGVNDHGSLLRLLESWTWAAASIGEYYPLLILGLNEEINTFVEKRLKEFHVQDSVRLSPRLDPQYLPAMYQASIGLVHLGSMAPWGSSVRHALACGKAIVAHKQPQTEAVVGTAAYLVDPEDLRSFGAAMITIVVDEKAREKLEEAAWQRASKWDAAKFKSELLKIYREDS